MLLERAVPRKRCGRTFGSWGAGKLIHARREKAASVLPIVRELQSHCPMHASTVGDNVRTIGSYEEQVIEESRETIDAQMQSLVNGTIPCVMLPVGSSYIPKTPEGFESVKVSGPGAGTFLFNPKMLSADIIRQAAEEGTHGTLLGHLQLKKALSSNAWCVSAVLPSGVVVQDSVVSVGDPELLEAQKRVLRQRHPGAEILVRVPVRVLATR